jgi:hypothetical protein
MDLISQEHPAVSKAGKRILKSVQKARDAVRKSTATTPGTPPTGKISDAFGTLKRPGQRRISIEEMNDIIAKAWAGKR